MGLNVQLEPVESVYRRRWVVRKEGPLCGGLLMGNWYLSQQLMGHCDQI